MPRPWEQQIYLISGAAIWSDPGPVQHGHHRVLRRQPQGSGQCGKVYLNGFIKTNY